MPSLVRRALVAALVLLPAAVFARCGDDPGDAAAIADARAAIEAKCQCATTLSHGAYVACATTEVRARIRSGALPRRCGKSVRKCAARSTCGKRGAVACCLSKKGRTRCAIKKKLSKCLAKGGCLGTVPSCCDACGSGACGASATTTSTTTTTLGPGSTTTTVVSSTTTTTLAEGQACLQENPSPTVSEVIPCGGALSCTLDPAGDQDAFTFDAPDGAAVSVVASGTRITCWQIFGPTGQLNQPQCGKIGSVILPQAGSYTILVTQQLNRATDYVLSMQGVSQPFHCGAPITVPTTLTDSLTPAGDTDSFEFVADAGKTFSIGIAGAHQPCWQVFGPDGHFLINPPPCRTDGAKNVTTTVAGTQTIVVNELTNQATDYTLSIQPVGP